jgi:hypothetical protein
MKMKIVLYLMIMMLLLVSCSPATTNQSGAVVSMTPKVPTFQRNPTATMVARQPGPVEATSADVDDAPGVKSGAVSYPIVDTGQRGCYDNTKRVACPSHGAAFNGQDAQYEGDQPHYQDNGNGTVTDRVTGLMWQQDPGKKMTYAQAVAGASSLRLGDYTDWRLPTIEELYSLILFTGIDPKEFSNADTTGLSPFISDVFTFQYGKPAEGDRIIDSQFISSTRYVSTTMNGNATVFGVNFADGRIKGYPSDPMPGQNTAKLFYVLYVRGGTGYGLNDFHDNGNGTITDNATRLSWMQSDSGKAMNWETALSYCENLDFAGASDWRLPNIKELQSLVDYTRSPDITQSAAINPIFKVTAITNEKGQSDYPFTWSSTTHVSSRSADFAAYISFGRALGNMQGQWMDVHGAGAQRSDPKAGNPAEHVVGQGPQGDTIRINNYARCVRGGTASNTPGSAPDTAYSGGTNQPLSEQNGQGGQTGEPGKPFQERIPPQAALEVCSARVKAAGCQFSTPNGAVSGTCQLVPPRSADQILVCVPVKK